MKFLSLNEKIRLWKKRLALKEQEYLNKRFEWISYDEVIYKFAIQNSKFIDDKQRTRSRLLYVAYMKSYMEYVILCEEYLNFKLLVNKYERNHNEEETFDV